MLTRRSFENYEEAALETSLSPECTLHKFKATDANGLRVEYDWHVRGLVQGKAYKFQIPSMRILLCPMVF